MAGRVVGVAGSRLRCYRRSASRKLAHDGERHHVPRLAPSASARVPRHVATADQVAVLAAEIRVVRVAAHARDPSGRSACLAAARTRAPPPQRRPNPNGTPPRRPAICCRHFSRHSDALCLTTSTSVEAETQGSLTSVAKVALADPRVVDRAYMLTPWLIETCSAAGKVDRRPSGGVVPASQTDDTDRRRTARLGLRHATTSQSPVQMHAAARHRVISGASRLARVKSPCPIAAICSRFATPASVGLH